MEVKDELNLRKFVVPEFVFGVGARHLAGRYARNFGARKVLVVSDPGVIQAGWTAQVADSLRDEAISFTIFSQVTSNPRAEEVIAGVEVFQRESCNLIVAVGGGSPMDCAGTISLNSQKRLCRMTVWSPIHAARYNGIWR